MKYTIRCKKNGLYIADEMDWGNLEGATLFYDVNMAVKHLKNNNNRLAYFHGNGRIGFHGLKDLEIVEIGTKKYVNKIVELMI